MKNINFKKRILKQANDNLRKLFPEKHIDITMSDINKAYSRQQLSIESDFKTSKGSLLGYLTGVLYLAPSNLSGINTCVMSSLGCKAACLFTAGRGMMYSVTRSRIIRTLAFYFDKPRYIKTLKESIRKLRVKAKNKGMIPIVRLNGTSDIMWDKVTDIIQTNPDLQFYDYTKIDKRFYSELPVNYDLTFSVDETNHQKAKQILQLGFRVAVVFNDIPNNYWNIGVINGDNTDLRFLDPVNCIVGLKAKGKAKKDKTGFVQHI